MTKKDHFDEFRQHMVDLFALPRFIVPASVNTKIKIPQFFEMSHGKICKTAYFVQAISRALQKVPEANSGFIRNRFSKKVKILYFDEIHANIAVYKNVKNTKFPFNYVIHNSDKLSIDEISSKIAYVRDNPVEKIPEFMGFLQFLSLPRFTRKRILKKMVRDEEIYKMKVGTFSISNLSMIEGIVGGALPAPRLLVDFALDKVNKEIKFGYNFNHAIIDGMHIAKLNHCIIKTFKKCNFD